MSRRSKPGEPLVSDPSSEPPLASSTLMSTSSPSIDPLTINSSSSSSSIPPMSLSIGPPPPVLTEFASHHQQYVKSVAKIRVNSTGGAGTIKILRGNINNSTKSKPIKTSHLIWMLLALPLLTATIFMGTGYYYLLPSNESAEGASGKNVRSSRLSPVKLVSTSTTLVEQQSSDSSKRNVSSSTLSLTNPIATLATSQPVRYHIVFSTSCSVFQDWQSYVFFYQAIHSGQTGIITRIVSGCANQDEEDKARAVFEQEIVPMAPPGRVRIHFTPDYARIMDGGVHYPYFNKPFGMRHWLENELGFPGPAEDTNDAGRDDTVVVLCDPDQIILRPFPADNDYSNTQWYQVPPEKARTAVTHGGPMGQLYGFDLQWLRINMTEIIPDEISPISTMSRSDAQSGYIVGPPYIATASDMYAIVVKWCEFGPGVYKQYPHLLAEMFAYCLAAAHLLLSHQTAASFMVSDVGTGPRMEGWGYVDQIPAEEICLEHDPARIPNVIHFCQRYGVGRFFFGKRRLPGSFLSCESPLLVEPPLTLALDYDHSINPEGKRVELKPNAAKRNAFMLCYLIRVVNRAAGYWKSQHCASRSQIANMNQTMMLVHVDDYQG